MSGPTPLRPEPDRMTSKKEGDGGWPVSIALSVFLICLTVIVLEKC